MKVLCSRLIDEKTGNVINQSPWLTLGKTYHVLEIWHSFGKPTLFRLLSDDGYTPALYDASQFEMLTNVIPSNWIVSMKVSEFFSLTPKTWDVPNFWESFFDGDPHAKKIFSDTYNFIVDEE